MSHSLKSSLNSVKKIRWSRRKHARKLIHKQSDALSKSDNQGDGNSWSKKEKQMDKRNKDFYTASNEGDKPVRRDSLETDGLTSNPEYSTWYVCM